MIYMNKSIRILMVIVSVMMFSNCFGQLCGTFQTLNATQKTQINTLAIQLDSALAHEDFSAIDSLNRLIKTTYSAEGGKPDVTETYYKLLDTSNWLNLSTALALSRKLIAADSIVYANLWKTAKGMAPPLYLPNSIYLRSSAEIAVGLLKIANKETDLSRKALYQSWAIRTLDSLATMQLPNGAFPFPDLRSYKDPVFSSIIQNYLNSLGSDSSSVLANGWIIDDRNSGEFKFDAGVIGNAYYEAYISTGNIKYKNIAISVANYLLPLKMNVNYNYNTFVSLALTRGYQLSNNLNFLNRAILNLRYGLYPGQLANGRWVDGHNANSRYQNLIIQNITPTINLMSSTNPSKIDLDTMAVRSIQNMISYTNNCNSATGFRWLMSSYLLDSSLFTVNTRKNIIDLIGKHITQAEINGKYLDVPSMGQYLELVNPITLGIGIKDLINVDYNIYPNPFQDQVTINVLGDFEYNLYSITGKEVEKGTGNNAFTIGRDLSEGSYFINIKSKDGNIINRLTKIN
jgi:hypothetical protein